MSSFAATVRRHQRTGMTDAVAVEARARDEEIGQLPEQRLRVRAVEWSDPIPLHEGLADSAFQTLRNSEATKPSDDDLRECDLVLIGCTERMLTSPAVRKRVAKLASQVGVIAVIARPGPDAGLRAMRAGFRGVISREVSPQALDRAAEAAVRGEIVLPRHAISALVRWIERLAPASRTRARALTPRQREVVGLIAHGATDREIAVVLQISEETAHKHVQNALRRANARRRSQLVSLMSAPRTARTPPNGFSVLPRSEPLRSFARP
jgi:DNA-binding NarL/FixJ family response regulator